MHHSVVSAGSDKRDPDVGPRFRKNGALVTQFPGLLFLINVNTFGEEGDQSSLVLSHICLVDT